MFHLTKIEKQYCSQLKYYCLGLTQEGEGASVHADHSEPAPTNTPSTGCPTNPKKRIYIYNKKRTPNKKIKIKYEKQKTLIYENQLVRTALEN
jgi:hypothetical protein